MDRESLIYIDRNGSDCVKWDGAKARFGESGLLPQTQDERSSAFLENVVAAGIDNSELPKCPANYWAQLNDWLGTVMDLNGLRK